MREAENEQAPGVGDRNREALQPRAEVAAGVGEHGVSGERRARGVQAQAGREDERRADSGVVPLEEEPGEAGSREQRTESIAGPTQPERKPDADERPPCGEKRQTCHRRRGREPAAGVVPCNVERQDSGGSAESQDRDGRRLSTHTGIVPPCRSVSNQGAP